MDSQLESTTSAISAGITVQVSEMAKIGSFVTSDEIASICEQGQHSPLNDDNLAEAVLPVGRFLDRELSWLQFNERVLEQAEDTALPLLERAWFAAIFASNLDEFFMVRVAGLMRRIATGMATTKAAGISPRRQIDAIRERAHELMLRHAALFRDDIRPALAQEGIDIILWPQLSEQAKECLGVFYRQEIFPVLTPLAVDPAHPFPYISGLSINLAVLVKNPATEKTHFARVKVPQLLPRFVAIDEFGHPYRPEEVPPDSRGHISLVPLEEIIGAHLATLFPGMEVVEYHTFRVTRNEDVEVEEDDAENLLKAMEREIRKRRFGPAVRIEVAQNISSRLLTLLVKELAVSDADVYHLPAPLDLTGLNIVHDIDRPDIKYKRFVPVTPAGLAERETAKAGDIFAAIRRDDVIVHHPYDAFSTSVQEFLAQAARDPDVLAIKQTLYRTSGDSPIIDCLVQAARAGKQVLAVVEIKARFDEEANIGWARKIERAGVHVVYGIVGLKTHCKLLMVVRRESDGLRRYCHVGTGNYHPKTARGYEDFGLLTCDQEVGQDVTRLFNRLSGYAQLASFHRIIVAPDSIRDGLVERIDNERANAIAGKSAYVKIKVNSIVDESVIDALYRASQAGVQVDLVVRGICGIRPGIKGISNNIRVRSILGRFLEHSRIYIFGNDGQPQVWIGSADLMHRNLYRRVEALIRVVDSAQMAYLERLIDTALSETTASWHLDADGWHKYDRDEQGNKILDLQGILMARARSRVVDK